MFVIATRNSHKIVEIREILGRDFPCLGLDAFPPAPEVIEDAGSFSGNATKKAVETAKWLASLPLAERKRRCLDENTWVLADDSGLEVDALNGAPGIHSARFAALDTSQSGNSNDADNRAKLLRLLKDVAPERRAARFRCVLALTPLETDFEATSSNVCYADELELQTRIFEGTCEGTILSQERGGGGFGYDSLFVPAGYDQSFAELPDTVKSQISHRAAALSKLKVELTK